VWEWDYTKLNKHAVSFWRKRRSVFVNSLFFRSLLEMSLIFTIFALLFNLLINFIILMLSTTTSVLFERKMKVIKKKVLMPSSPWISHELWHLKDFHTMKHEKFEIISPLTMFIVCWNVFGYFYKLAENLL
jgi:hypothetical protein